MNQSRINRIVENMQKENLNQILVTNPPSIYYLTGRWIVPGERMVALLVRGDGTATLFANRLFALQGNISTPLVEYDDTEDSIEILASALAPGRIGIDKFWPSQFTIRLMAARSDVTPVLGSKPVDEARMLKDAEELDLLRIASRKNDEVLAKTIAGIHSGMTENDVASLYRANAKACGTRESFDSLVCFGPNCAEPHHATDDTPLQSGDAIICDVGVLWQSYCADMTRTVFFGSATDEQKRVYDVVAKANAAGRAAVRPGVAMKEFDLAARKVIEDAGYGKYFIHRTGHGIGLEVHEHPDNSATSEVIARPGMVFSVEPGVYLPGKFGVRVEDLVVVTEDGVETLNALSRDFRVI